MNSKVKIFVLIYLFFCGFIINLSAQNGDLEWKLVREVDDIKVYTRKTNESEIKEIRIECYFNIDKESFYNLLKNADLYSDWVFKCTESRKLESVNSREFYYYVVTDLPFPVNDRDMVVLTRSWIDENTGNITSFSESKPNHLPTDDEYIRVPFYQSSWIISDTNDGKTYVEYQSLTDPGGSLPIWMVNLAVTSGPIKTMQALQQLTDDQ